MEPVSRPSHLRSTLTSLALGAVLTASLAPLGLAPTAVAADFPPGDTLYHGYDEMVAELQATEAAYPELFDAFSIGTSYEGREIWAGKISDNVATDEPEPEILFDALHHAREHLTLEQALYVLRLLTSDYGVDPEIAPIVDNREIWIIFAVNPDGAEFDLTGPGGPRGPYAAWRKNRQPNAGSAYVGTDLNRNYDYRWACCGGSSGARAAITYRGPAPFSAPETRAFRDFVNSRVLDGRQQITAHITFHTNGELVLYPYGYTTTAVPADMTALDQRTFLLFARGQAARNGYTAKQSSHLYVTDGDQIDWMYGRHRIFSFTWELFPTESGTVWRDHYPQDEQIAWQTERNRTALLYFMNAAGCPYTVLGAAVRRTQCGPFNDDLEGARGWVVNPDGTDTASRGAWERGNPVGSSVGRRLKQLGTTPSGRYDLSTGPALGSSASANDLDGGTTTIRSSDIALPAVPGNLTFKWAFGSANGSTAADALSAWVQAADGARTLVFRWQGRPGGRDASWVPARIPLGPWAGQSIRIVFGATDGGADNLVEAAVDDVRVERP